MVFAAGSLAPLPAPAHELNLGRNLQLRQILHEEADATRLRRTKITGRILVSPFQLQGTRGKRHG